MLRAWRIVIIQNAPLLSLDGELRRRRGGGSFPTLAFLFPEGTNRSHCNVIGQTVNKNAIILSRGASYTLIVYEPECAIDAGHLPLRREDDANGVFDEETRAICRASRRVS